MRGLTAEPTSEADDSRPKLAPWASRGRTEPAAEKAVVIADAAAAPNTPIVTTSSHVWRASMNTESAPAATRAARTMAARAVVPVIALAATWFPAAAETA